MGSGGKKGQFRPLRAQAAIAIGAGQLGHRFAELNPEKRLGIRLLGFLDDSPEKTVSEVHGYPVIGSSRDLPKFLSKRRIRHIFITRDRSNPSELLRMLDILKGRRVTVHVAGKMLQAVYEFTGYSELPEITLVPLKCNRPSPVQLAIKRMVEVLFTLLVLIALAPVFLLIGVLVKLTSRGSIFYRQTAIGMNGQPFRMFKFRTMVDGNNLESHKAWIRRLVEKGDIPYTKITDDSRVTLFGNFLRKFSLDELPQFFNVLLGEMSIIAPRPPLTYEYESYDDWHKRRLSIRPGITGLNQIMARDEGTFNDMVALDLFYIYNYSWLMDIQIAIRTIPTMLFGKGGG